MRIYIAYHPYVSQYMAYTLYHKLTQHGHDVFMAAEDRSYTKPAANMVYAYKIQTCDRFLAILTPGLQATDQRHDKWFWHELQLAQAVQSNCIPLLAHGFTFDEHRRLLEDCGCAKLATLQPVALDQDHLTASVNRIVDQLTGVPAEKKTRLIPLEIQADMIAANVQIRPVPTVDCLQAEAHLNAALLRHEQGDLAAADALLTAALERHPHYYNARNSRLIVRATTDSLNAALVDFRACRRLEPTNFRAYYSRGLIYSQRGMYDQALKDMSRVVDLCPRSAANYTNRGMVRYRIGDYRGALYDFGQSTTVDPNHPETFAKRGLTYLCLQDYERAMHDFERLAAAEDGSRRVLAGKALAWYGAGDTRRAEQQWQRLLAQWPHTPDLPQIAEELEWKAEITHLAEALLHDLS